MVVFAVFSRYSKTKTATILTRIAGQQLLSTIRASKHDDNDSYYYDDVHVDPHHFLDPCSYKSALSQFFPSLRIRHLMLPEIRTYLQNFRKKKMCASSYCVGPKKNAKIKNCTL